MLLRCLMVTTFTALFGTSESGYCIDHGYVPKNGDRSPPPNVGYKFYDGSIIRYFCKPFYALNASSAVQTCLPTDGINFRWIPELFPTCVQVQEKPCPPPLMIEHGTFVTYTRFKYATFPPGSRIQYNCSDGYHLEPMTQQYRECRNGEWTGPDPSCVSDSDGCFPPDGTDYIPIREHYQVGDTVTFVCTGDIDVMSICQPNHKWSDQRCNEALSTVQMPSIPSDEIYCKLPQPPILNGEIKCCVDSTASQINSTSSPNDCCPERGIVEFICNEGYTLKGASNQWMCSSYGEWLDLDQDGSQRTAEPPNCLSNSTREPTFSDETLKQVFGVAAGVLVILSAVMIIALCRPKLINMKRRWRELRDDEDELIIDGRRITLPSYDEAMTSRDSYPPEEQSSLSHSDNITRSSASERQGIAPEISLPNVSRKDADDDMLFFENSSTLNDGGTTSSVQSLILTAGTSMNDTVMINSVQDTHHDDDVTDTIRRRNSDDDAMLVLESDSECNLDTIYPSNSSLISPANQSSKCTDSDYNLLKFPLRPVDSASNSFFEPQSFSVIINPSNQFGGEESPEEKKIIEPGSSDVGPSGINDAFCHDEDLSGSLAENSDSVHMKSSTPMKKEETEKTGSTVV